MQKRVVTKQLKLAGLSCTGCETRIETGLLDQKGVTKAEVSFRTSILDITYDEAQISLDKIVKTIENLDYTVVDRNVKAQEKGKTQQKSKTAGTAVAKSNMNQKQVQNDQNPSNKKISENTWLIAIGIAVLGIYLIINNTIGFNYIPEVNQNMGYGLLFVVGMFTSLHCVAMCGGINLSVCISYQENHADKEKEQSKYAKFIPTALYHSGRVVSYTVIGGLVGALGSVFSISNTGSAIVSAFAGIFMIIMGLNMLNVFPQLRRLNPHMPKIFAKKINQEKTKKGPFVVGLLNGLMPCGPLQAMQLYALGTGSFIAGALSMFIFSIGTVPLLFAFGALGSLLSSKFTKKLLKVSAALVMVLGFIMINRGLAFAGVTIDSVFSSFSDNTASAQSTVVETTTTESSQSTDGSSTSGQEVQKISSTLESSRSYPKITVQAGIPVEWTITVDSKNLNSCNNQIIIPEYNIKQKLVAGDNVITFTPTETGSFGYSCWMGMIRSSITVVAADTAADTASNTSTSDSDTTVDNTGLPAGCCAR